MKISLGKLIKLLPVFFFVVVVNDYRCEAGIARPMGLVQLTCSVECKPA